MSKALKNLCHLPLVDMKSGDDFFSAAMYKLSSVNKVDLP